MRRLAITLLVAPFAGLVGLSLLGGAASASSPVGATVPPDSTASAGDAAADLAPVDVLQVSGLFDAVTVQSIEAAIAMSARRKYAFEGNQLVISVVDAQGRTTSRATYTKS